MKARLLIAEDDANIRLGLVATLESDGYDVTAARGFIDLFGLPMKVASQAKKW